MHICIINLNIIYMVTTIILILGAFCAHLSLCFYPEKTIPLIIYRFLAICSLVFITIFPYGIFDWYIVNLICTLLLFGFTIAVYFALSYTLFLILGHKKLSKIVYLITKVELDFDDYC